MASLGKIETGVDKLISLIERKKKISISDAAKELSVPKTLLEEWINFLEEKEIISIEYKFTTPYIVKKEITEKDIKKQEKDFIGRKEGFVRKIESALSNIKKEKARIGDLKKEFSELGKDVDKDVKHVADDLEVLQNYENMKRNLDKDILKKQHDFENELQTVKQEILEDVDKYKHLIEDVKSQELKLMKDRGRAEQVKKEEESIKQNLIDITDALNILRAELKKQDALLEEDKKNFDKLNKLADNIKKNIEAKQKKVEGLKEESDKNAQVIFNTQKDVLKKVVERRKMIEDSVTNTKNVQQKFETFFERKSRVDKAVSDINKEVITLETELSKLAEEVRMFQLTSKGTDVKAHLKEAENRFREIKKNEEKFEQDVVKLSKIVKS